MSWKPEVQVHKDEKWYSNGLRFATKDEAHRSARSLFYRWTQCVEYRASESDDEVTDYLDEDGKRWPIKVDEELGDGEKPVEQFESNKE